MGGNYARIDIRENGEPRIDGSIDRSMRSRDQDGIDASRNPEAFAEEVKMNVSGLPFQYYLKRFPRDCLTRSLRIDQSRSSQISRFRRYVAVVPPPFFRGVLKATPCERVACSL